MISCTECGCAVGQSLICKACSQEFKTPECAKCRRQMCPGCTSTRQWCIACRPDLDIVGAIDAHAFDDSTYENVQTPCGSAGPSAPRDVPSTVGPAWIVIPGQYSGDVWHMAAALLLHDNLQCIISTASDTDKEGAPPLLTFLAAIGLDTRVQTCDAKKKGNTIAVGVEERPLGGLSRVGKSQAWQAVSYVQEKLPGEISDPAFVHVVYRSTSAILHSIEQNGRESTIARLQDGFTHGLPGHVVETVGAAVRDLLEGHRRVLFVFNRPAGYNVQHNLSVTMLANIAESAGKHFSIVLVCNKEKVEKEEDVMKLVGDYAIRLVDLMELSMSLSDPKMPDERIRAQFWVHVQQFAASNGIIVKFIGGRSGSTDLPAFLGIDVLCWDECDFTNIEYLRLLITAPALLTLTHTLAVALKGSNVHLLPRNRSENDLALFQDDLALFLAREPGAPRPRPQFSMTRSDNLKKKMTPKKQAQAAATPLMQLQSLCALLFLPNCAPAAFTALDTLIAQANGGVFDWNNADPGRYLAYQPPDAGGAPKEEEKPKGEKK